MKKYIIFILLLTNSYVYGQQNYLWKISNDSVYISNNNGASWRYLRTGAVFSFGHLYGSEVLRARNDSLFAEINGNMTYLPSGLIRVATQLVSSQIIGLDGGTTGQYLRKNSNTNWDYSWVLPPAYSTVATADSMRTNIYAAINGKQPVGNYLTSVTKADVGLANAENTSDANKPISSATQTALNAKQATLVSATNIKTINGASVLGSGDLVVSGSGASRVFLPNDVSNANAVANTISDISGLAFPVVANTTYRFKYVIIYNSAATTTGARFSINGVANTFVHYTSQYTLTATSITNNAGLAGYNVPSGANASSLATGNICIIEGIIRPTANGEIIARFASEISSSAITALAGGRSYVEYQIIN